MPDGRIEFVGRNDWQVKIRGFRIEPGEIEARLAEYPGINEAVVIAEGNGIESKRLVAYYTGEKLEVEVLRGRLLSELPDYMAPAAYVHLEKLPLTPNGKLDRRALPAPDVRSIEERNGYLAAQTPVEEIVVGIFQDVLKLERVGKRENFFELGGHSLLATQAISRVRKVSGVEIELKSIFEEPTAEGLANRIEEAMKAGEKASAPPMLRASREERLPLSFAQQRLWFLDQLTPNNPFYNIPGAVRLAGRLDLEVLESVINEIVRRHEVLRTRFEVEEGEPAQVIDAWEPRSLEVEDLTVLPQEEREEEARRLASEEAGMGFDLSRGPLLRVKALKLGEEEHILLFTMHHIVSDGWSMGILSSEVGDLYRAYSAGDPSPLEELPIQYADFAVWQRERLQGEALERELEYWRRQLIGFEPLNLPTDRPRPVTPSHRGGVVAFSLSAEVSAQLIDLSRREGVTLFMSLLAAFNVALHKRTGLYDITVGTDVANRNRSETENLIGFFVNQLVLRTNLGGNPTFRDLLGRVREVTLGAYAHQDVPFEKVVAALRPERSLSHTPLFQVKVLMANTPTERLALPGVELEMYNAANNTSKFDLTLTMTDTPEGIRCVFNYDMDLFDAGVAEIWRYFEALINYVVTAPGATVKDLKERLDEVDKEQWVLKEKELAEVELITFKSSKRRTIIPPV
jgi:acyl carrier protein